MTTLPDRITDDKAIAHILENLMLDWEQNQASPFLKEQIEKYADRYIELTGHQYRRTANSLKDIDDSQWLAEYGGHHQ